MELEILCEPSFPANESAELHKIADELGMTPEEVIRYAVRDFVAECVPTQSAAPTFAEAFASKCVPTHG